MQVGPPNAGKTTILSKIGESVGPPKLSTSTASRLDIEKVSFRGLEFMSLVNFSQNIKPYRSFFRHTRGVIFVLDISAKESFQIARDLLHQLLADDELRNTAILIFANKADLPGAVPTSYIISQLGLRKLRSRVWNVQRCAAEHEYMDRSFYEGLNWLADQLASANRSQRNK